MQDSKLANPNKAQYESSVGAMETTIRNANEANKKAINAWAAAETALIQQRDAQKYQRINQQDAKLNDIENQFDQQVSQRRADLDTIRKRQETIAARNANMAVAQAGQGGVQLSEWEKQSINDDTLGKFGENIANADQSRFQGNASLDQAQKGAKMEVYAKRSDLNGLLASLDDAGKSALIDAARRARDGDLEAEKQVANSILEYQKKQSDETYNRFAAQERYIAEENAFRSGSVEQKIAQLTANVGQIPWAEFANKNIRNYVQQYPNASFEELTNLIKQEAANTAQGNAERTTAIGTGTLNLKDNPDFISSFNQWTQTIAGATNRVQTALGNESTAWNQFPREQFANSKTQQTGIKIPTTQEIEQVRQVLERGKNSGTLSERDYNRYLLGINKIQTNGMDAQQYANTYGNPAWLARLGKAK